MKLTFRTTAIAACAFASVALLSPKADAAARVYIYGPNPYYTATGLPWYAVRAYYAGGPWCAVGGTSGYGMAGGLWGGSWSCYSGWADYAQRNGIGCTPGTAIKGGDGIMYVCQ